MKNQRYFIIVLWIVVAGILSSCDPAPRPYLIANRMIVVDNTPYIHVSERQSWGGCCDSKDHYFVSQDYGKTWKEISSVPAQMPTAIEDPTKVQLATCVPNDEKVCYRIAGKEQVEISNDGGKTWQIDWNIPLGRKLYMERNPDIVGFERVAPDTVPFDFGIIAIETKHVVIVAMGNQGMLVKSSGGVWERYAIPSIAEYPMLATPLPFYASSFKDAIKVLGTETAWLCFITFIFFVSISFSTWGNINKNVDQTYRRKIQQSYLPFFIASAGFICYVFLLLASLVVGPFQGSWLVGLSITACFVPIIGLLISWLSIIAITPNHKIGAFAGLAALGYTIAFGIGTYSSFILWALGIIPIYETALAVSIILGILITVLGLRHEKRLAIQAIIQ